MSEPETSPDRPRPEQAGITGPEAFEPRPEAAGTGGKKGGCSRPLLIGCGVLLVLLGIGAVILVLNGPKLAIWLYGKLETQIETRLPDDLPAADRQHLQQAFDHVRAAIADRSIDPVALQHAQTRMVELVQGSGKLTAEQVRELADLLDTAAGVSPPEDTGGDESTDGEPEAGDSGGDGAPGGSP